MLSLYSISALAGHGFMNSFANIEWLPEAGLTPNQSFYFLDSFAEKIEILLSQGEGHQGEAYLKLSKEKLAEIVEMAKKERTKRLNWLQDTILNISIELSKKIGMKKAKNI